MCCAVAAFWIHVCLCQRVCVHGSLRVMVSARVRLWVCVCLGLCVGVFVPVCVCVFVWVFVWVFVGFIDYPCRWMCVIVWMFVGLID